MLMYSCIDFHSQLSPFHNFGLCNCEMDAINLKEVIDLGQQSTDNQLLDEVIEQDVSILFKALSNPTRIKILFALKQQPLTVSEITDKLNMTQSAISHQLKELKMARLVSYHKKGRKMIYELADDHVHQIFDMAVEHVMEVYNYD